MNSYFSEDDLNRIQNKLAGYKHYSEAKKLLENISEETLHKFYVDELKIIIDFLKTKEKKQILKGGKKQYLVSRILDVVKGNTSPSIGPWPKFGSIASRSKNTFDGDQDGGGNVPNNNPLRNLSVQEERVFEKLQQEIKKETLQSHDPFYKPLVLVDVFHIYNTSKTRSFKIGFKEEHLNMIKNNDRIQCHLVLYYSNLSAGEWLMQMKVDWNERTMVPKRVKKRKRNKSSQIHYTTVPIVIGKHQILRENQLHIFFPPYIHFQGDIALEIVERRTAQELAEKVKENSLDKNNKNKNKTLYQKTCSNNDENDEIQVADHETVSLVDPVVYTRIEIPAKGSKCFHKTCFDLYNFLELSHTQGKWVCPICGKKVPYHSLIVDPLISKALNMTNDEHVQIKQDGTIVPISSSQKSDELANSPDSQHTSTSEQKSPLLTTRNNKTPAPVVTIEDDGSDDIDSSPTGTKENGSNNNNDDSTPNNTENNDPDINSPSDMDIDEPSFANNIENAGQSWDDPICL